MLLFGLFYFLLGVIKLLLEDIDQIMTRKDGCEGDEGNKEETRRERLSKEGGEIHFSRVKVNLCFGTRFVTCSHGIEWGP